MVNKGRKNLLFSNEGGKLGFADVFDLFWPGRGLGGEFPLQKIQEAFRTFLRLPVFKAFHGKQYSRP